MCATAAAMDSGLVTSRWRACAEPSGLGKSFGGGEVDVGDPDEGAGADEFLHGGFADAAGAAGDEGVAAFEAEGLRGWRMVWRSHLNTNSFAVDLALR